MRLALGISYCAFFLLLASCGPTATPTLFIPPSKPQDTSTPAISIAFSTPKPSRTPIPVSTSTSLPFTPELSPSPANTQQVSPTPVCTPLLRYIQDINYPDGSLVSPGQTIEKQWQVENNGSCDWNALYRLKLNEGYPPLGAKSEMALYPARAGSRATLMISFTAPLESGTYRTSWQAADPNGNLFGDAIFMEIIVQP